MGSLKELPPALLREWFPNLTDGSYIITSPAAEEYNCIAWAAGDATKKWDPSPIDGRYWPPSLQRRYDLQTFAGLYNLAGGFVPTDTGSLETGVEKIALYAGNDNEVKHAALQLLSGLWTSKLGDFEDIEHTLASLEGGGYGMVRMFLKRERTVTR